MHTDELFILLHRYGFTLPKSVRFLPDEIPQVDFYPVALKTDSSKVIHKSDVCGVILDICDKTSLTRAKTKIRTNLSKAGISFDTGDALLAVEMVRGEEFYIGMANDTAFGKTIVFGKGGTLLELYRDVCYIDTRADKTEIIKSLKQTKIFTVFEGFRGSVHTPDEAVLLIQRFQDFIHANPHITQIDLNPLILTDKGFVVVDARARYSHASEMDSPLSPQKRPSFFQNRSVALVGASHDPSKVGYALAKNLLEFKGESYFVSLGGGKLFGKPCHKDISTLPDIDTAIIAVPVHTVYEQIEKLIPKGLRNVIVISAGFKESGNAEEESRIKQLARMHGLNLIGPNCLGYVNASRSLNATFGFGAPLPGDIALLAQSGAVLTALMDKAHDAGIGFSHIVSFGNMADFDFDDAIATLQEEPSCKTISVYAEGIVEGAALLEALRLSKKPVLFYKAGRTPLSQKAAFSHTGNLCGDYAVNSGLIRAAGAYEATSIESLIYAPRFLEANAITILTNAGGPGTILTDLVAEKNRTLYTLSPEDKEKLNDILPSNWSHNNPVDIIGDATSERFASALKIIQTFETDLIFVVVSPQFMTDAKAVAKALSSCKKPVVPVWLGGNALQKGKDYCKKKGILYFESLEAAVQILADTSRDM